jgi:secreted trypsin-like serine protease
MGGISRTVTMLAATALLAACSSEAGAQQKSCAAKRGKIVGGAAAVAAQWPGQAVLRLHSEPGRVSWYLCGGTAIADRWVLTAAHCLPGFLSKLTGPLRDSAGAAHEGRLDVVLGADDLTAVTSDHAYAVERVVMHERYRAAVDKAHQIADPKSRARAIDSIVTEVGDDIALLYLARPWSGSKAELSLSAASDPSQTTGIQVRVAGFGSTEQNKNSDKPDRFVRADGKGELFAGSARLLETAVTTIETGQCAKRYTGSVIGPGQLCAGLEQGGKDSCQGDSGGPLVVNDANNCPRQIGVVSWGEGCAEKQAYGVYTRISAYADWIQKHTGPLNGAAPLADASSARLTAAQLDEGLTQLDSILGPAKGRIKIGVRGGNRVRLKDKVIFDAASDIAGRLVILDINANREVMPLYPNQFVATGAIGGIAASQRVSVPGPDYPGFTAFEAQEPVGKGSLLALVVPEDFDIERFIVSPQQITKGFAPVNDPPSYLMRLIRQIETALNARGRAGATRADELKRWGYAVAAYEIVR